MRKFSRVLALALGVGLVAGAQALPVRYLVDMNGPNEFPTNNSPGFGDAQITIDTDANTLTIHADFFNLTGTTTASHIHGPTSAPGFQNAPVMTTFPSFVGFPLGVTSGTFDTVLDLTATGTYHPTFLANNGGVAGAEIALANAMADGKAYLNIHTSTFGGGEIRGFLRPAPEPGSAALLGLAALLLRRR